MTKPNLTTVPVATNSPMPRTPRDFGAKQWYVLYAKPQSEKKLAEQLTQNNIACYCPTRIEVRQWSDRKKKVVVPVLPSMVLVHIGERQRDAVFQCSSAVRYLFEYGKPAVVRATEVEALRLSLEQAEVVLEVQQLRPGQKINMEEAGFKQQQGTVQYVCGNRCRVVLEGVGYVVEMKMKAEAVLG